jgi:hypothetical protein
MRFAYRLDTHSGRVTIIAFPRQQWLHERASISHLYVQCLTLNLAAKHINNGAWACNFNNGVWACDFSQMFATRGGGR